MEALTVREYRNNLAESFDRAAAGERVLIRRKNSLYALVSIGEADISLTPSQKQIVSAVAESIRRSWQQVKQIEAGEIPAKSASAFINEL